MRTSTLIVASLLVLGSSGWPAGAGARGKPVPPPPAPTTPPARAGHGFAWNGGTVAGDSKLYLFGGAGSDFRALDDLWFYRADLLQWFPAPTGSTKPGPRQNHGWSCGAGQCLLVNGSNGVGAVKETWTYNEGNGAWSQLSCRRFLCPSARQMMAVAFNPSVASHLLFGGFAGGTTLDDTFTFSGGRWTASVPGTRPPARRSAAIAFVPPVVGKMVMFGGMRWLTEGQSASFEMLCDMWAWDGQDWERIATDQLDPGGPPCLSDHSMAWDGSRLIVTGGYVDTHDTPNQDVWTFSFTGASSGTWSKNLDANYYGCAYGARPGARMAHDRQSHTSVFFAGQENINNKVVRYADTVPCL